MAYDYSKLRGRIREKFKTQSNFAMALGIGTVSLSQKLNCKSEFTQDEINLCIQLLKLNQRDIPSYFFDAEV